jgi:hypothetical protein
MPKTSQQKPTSHRASKASRSHRAPTKDLNHYGLREVIPDLARAGALYGLGYLISAIQTCVERTLGEKAGLLSVPLAEAATDVQQQGVRVAQQATGATSVSQAASKLAGAAIAEAL